MGLNVTVDSVIYKKGGASFEGDLLAFAGRLEKTSEPRGHLIFDNNRASLTTRWNTLIGLRYDSLRNPFKRGLEVIKRHHANYQKEGKAVDLLDTKAWIISESSNIKVTYRDQNKNGHCDSVTVQMMQGGWKVFTLNIAVEDGVGTFVEKALSYLKEEEDIYITPLVPIFPSPVARVPVLPPMVSVNPPTPNHLVLNQ